MKLDYTHIIEFFFPLSEDALRLKGLDPDSFLSLYHTTIAAGHTALLPYTHPQVKAAIHLNKYHYHKTAQRLLSTVLTANLQSHAKHHTYIVPVPLSNKRLRARGYNQVTEILRHAKPSLPNCTVTEKYLIRTRDTVAQTTLGRKKRLQNMKNAFAVPTRTQSTVANAHIILVDDVTTTGATLTAAARALQAHAPASVTTIALAH